MSLTLQQVGQIAYQLGLGEEGAKVAMAIAQTEGGLGGAVGDQSIGGSYGPFQFYTNGQLPAYAKALGVSTQEAGQIAIQYPEHAANWALSNYLGMAIQAGIDKGLTGAQLATYAQTYGQGSENPERAGANYNTLFASAPADTGGDRMTGRTVPIPDPSTGRIPQVAAPSMRFAGYQQAAPGPVDGEVELSKEQLEELYRRATQPSVASTPVPAVPGSANSYAGFDPEAELAQATVRSSQPAAALPNGGAMTVEAIQEWARKKVKSLSPEPAQITVSEYGVEQIRENPNKSSLRVTFEDGTYMTVREATPGSKTYNVVNSGDAFKGSTGSDALGWARLQWDKAQAEIKALQEAGDLSLAQAKQMADQEYQRITAALTQRGQDVTQRGQDMSYASQMAQMAQSAATADRKNILPPGGTAEANKVFKAWKEGGVADVNMQPNTAGYSPATVGMDLAREMFGLPKQGAAVGPNGVQAPTTILPPQQAPVDLAARAVAGNYAIQTPRLNQAFDPTRGFQW
jgi:hypothetical protein